MTDDPIITELRKLAAGKRGSFTDEENETLTAWFAIPALYTRVYPVQASAWLAIAEAVALARSVAALEAWLREDITRHIYLSTSLSGHTMAGELHLDHSGEEGLAANVTSIPTLAATLIALATDVTTPPHYLAAAERIIAARPATPAPTPQAAPGEPPIVTELRRLAAGEREDFTTPEDKALAAWLGFSADEWMSVYDTNARAWLAIAEAVLLQRSVAVVEAWLREDEFRWVYLSTSLFGRMMVSEANPDHDDDSGSVGASTQPTLPAALIALAQHLTPDPHAATRQRIAELRAELARLEAEVGNG